MAFENIITFYFELFLNTHRPDTSTIVAIVVGRTDYIVTEEQAAPVGGIVRIERTRPVTAQARAVPRCTVVTALSRQENTFKVKFTRYFPTINTIHSVPLCCGIAAVV